jgi:hypothetical protein
MLGYISEKIKKSSNSLHSSKKTNALLQGLMSLYLLHLYS